MNRSSLLLGLIAFSMTFTIRAHAGDRGFGETFRAEKDDRPLEVILPPARASSTTAAAVNYEQTYGPTTVERARQYALQTLKASRFKDAYFALQGARIHVNSGCPKGYDAEADTPGNNIWIWQCALDRGTRYASMVLAHEAAHNAGHDHGSYIKSIEALFGY